MEGLDVKITIVQYNGLPIHMIRSQDEDYVFARAAERALYATDHHTGSLNRALVATAQPNPLALRRNALPIGISPTDYHAILQAYREYQLSVDPTSNRPPKCVSLVLVSSVAAIATELRPHRELLIVLGCDIPEQMQLEHEQQELAADPEGPMVDLLLEERIDELRELSLQEELAQFVEFPEQADDESKLVGYALSPVPRTLELQLNQYAIWKTQTFAFDRKDPAVVQVTASADVQSTLRFLGYLKHVHQIDTKSLVQLRSVDPSLVQSFCEWLVQRPVKHGSIANYLNQLTNVATFVASLPNEGDSSSGDETDDTLDSFVDAAYNLRSQAERQSKIDKLYQAVHPMSITWGEAKQTWHAALQAMEHKLKERPFKRAEAITVVEAALLISFNTVMPVDRVCTTCLHIILLIGVLVL